MTTRLTHALLTPVRRAGAGLAAFRRDRSGVVAIIFALALIPLVAAGGAAIDISRAFVVKHRLGLAIDAAGLAVGSSVGTQEELTAVMQKYFDANYPAGEIGTPATPSLQISGSVITLSATAEVDATLMRIVGIHHITVGVDAEIVRETKGLEVVLVLDNTGSMAGSKLSSLKTASEDFIDILFGQDSEPELLRMGIVPFVATVNIGTAMRTPYTKGPDEDDYDPDFWRGCVEARAYPRDVQDTWSNTSANRWRRYLWESSFTNPWPGIIGDRGQFRGPNKNCPVELSPLTNVKQDLVDKIDEMEANGNTHINLGAIWGWRVISPAEPFTEGRPYDDPEWNKAVVIMTDGDNTISGSSQDYSAYGSINEGRLGTTSTFAAANEMDDRLLEACTGMKNVGIIVYTITFQVNSSSTQNLMRSCATTNEHYFNSPTNEELQRVFRAIGAQLSNLRIGR